MAPERAGTTLAPQERLLLNIKREGISQGRLIADEILRDIHIAEKYIDELEPQLIKSYAAQASIPSECDPLEWGRFFEWSMNPLSPIDQSNQNCIQELALKHARHIAILEQGLNITKVNSDSEDKKVSWFDLTWTPRIDENGTFLYLYSQIKEGKVPLFLVISAKGTEGNLIRVSEKLIVAKNETSLDDYFIKNAFGTSSSEAIRRRLSTADFNNFHLSNLKKW